MKSLDLIVVAAGFLLFGVEGAAGAQHEGFARPMPRTDGRAGSSEDTYGTSSLTVYTVASVNFYGRNSSVGYTTNAGIERYISAGANALNASPNLPNGAQIEKVELRACDTNPADQVDLQMGTCPVPGSSCALMAVVSTGITATPGCRDFIATLPTPIVVNNQTTPILLSVIATTPSTTFSAVKLYYRLRISPAPAIASFPVDVPTTHPLFRFIEALAAAGITGGCGVGTYCPDAPMTRGQMAVFLATALGLHFPN